MTRHINLRMTRPQSPKRTIGEIPTSVTPTSMTAPEPRSRFLSESECIALAQRVASFALYGGETQFNVTSAWGGNLRYARNRITTSGDIRDHFIGLSRHIQQARVGVLGNQIGDAELQAAVRRAERLLSFTSELSDHRFKEHYAPVDTTLSHGIAPGRADGSPDPRFADASSLLRNTQETHLHPEIFFETTYNLSPEQRVAKIMPLIESARNAKLYAAGYVQVAAKGVAQLATWGRVLYYPQTTAEFSVTVRDPSGTGSGWAGVDWADWTRIDLVRLSEIAMDKCLRSRNPVAIEPGRYTTILEPQAVCQIFSGVVDRLDRVDAELGNGPFGLMKGQSKIGLRVLDERITISADPMDPDLGFVPFDWRGDAFKPVTWIENGVLKELAYSRSYGRSQLEKNSSLPNSKAFRMSGGTSTIEDMINTTKRGVLVTRFSGMQLLDRNSLLYSGYTRDGLWLIENGKISKAIKNFRFLESPMFIFNNLEDLGTPVRVYSPAAPVVVPPAKVRDFSFTSLIEAA